MIENEGREGDLREGNEEEPMERAYGCHECEQKAGSGQY